MQRVLWQIGRFQIQTFGFFIGIGMLAGMLVSYSEAKRKKMADEFLDFLTWALVLGTVGAPGLHSHLKSGPVPHPPGGDPEGGPGRAIDPRSHPGGNRRRREVCVHCAAKRQPI